MKNFPIGNVIFIFITSVEQVFINGLWGSWGMMETGFAN